MLGNPRIIKAGGRFFVCLVFSLFLPVGVYAGGAHQTNVNGVPYRWESAVIYNLDRGNLKSGVYDQAEANQMVAEAFNTWESVLDGGGLSISAGEGLPLGGGSDLNGSNYDAYLNSDADVNPIVFDEDGEIIDAIFGKCSKFNILAFAGFEKISSSTATIKKARAVFGGACIPDSSGDTLTESGCGPCSIVMDDALVREMILHEIGHFLGMDHSQVNPESYQSCNNSFECPNGLAEDIPTMYPLAVKGAAMHTLHRDDEAYFKRLYEDFTDDGCSVSGKVLASDGTTPLRGIEVIVRNVDSNLENTDAISFISGAEAPRFESNNKDPANCKEGCGDFLITGLADGETYKLCVQNILTQFSGTAGLEPVDPPQQLVTADCPAGISLACTCQPGSGCEAFVQDIVTIPGGSFDPSANINAGSFASSGGCSLARPARKFFWLPFKNLLEFHFPIQ